MQPITRYRKDNRAKRVRESHKVVLMNNTEIERKFLVVGDAFLTQAVRHYDMEQGYLCKAPERTVRVRIRDTRAFLTIKSTQNSTTLAHFEWEKEIDVQDARQLLALCLPTPIHKTRYIVPATDAEGQPTGLKWEIDVFHGTREGLRIAEIELPSEDTVFNKPEFVGTEVTDNPAYYNANL